MATNKQTNTSQQGIAQQAKSDNEAVAGRKNQETLWDYADLNAGLTNWNKVFPYRLVIWRRSEVGDWNPDPVLASFTLPIAPESLSISVPYAVDVAVTLGGIVEQHNGAPLRTISITGTTGVMPLKGQIAGAAVNRGSAALTQAGAIFAGTAAGLNQLQTQILGSGLGPSNTLVSDNDPDTLRGTGYHQFKLLQRFLETYMALKKTADGRDYVLALELWKDQEVYFVAPMSFDLRRSAQNPLEYPYSLVFRAWKRVNLAPDTGNPAIGHLPVARDPNKLAQVMNALDRSRRVLESVRQTLSGVRADINAVLFTPIRETVLFLKDILGTALVATDLPANIISDLKDPILEALSLGKSLQDFGSSINGFPQKTAQAWRDLAIATGKAQSGGATAPGAGTNQSALSADAESGASPALKTLTDPDTNYAFYSQVKPGNLNLRPSTVRAVNNERSRLKSLKREDFEARRDAISLLLSDFESSLGLGNGTFAATYSTKPQKVLREATDSDFEIIFELNSVLTEMNRMVASSTINRDEISSIDYIAGLATRSGIAFKVPRSKFLAPLMYGHTLEQLAQVYLGDADRWHEIATLNGLMAPYIDETGFKLPLLTNGNGNTVVVSDGSKIVPNQLVWISSSTASRTRRRVTAVDRLGLNQYMVTVDGEANMEQFTVGALPILESFLPNTVNSQQSLFIPSDTEPNEEDYRQKTIPGVDQYDPLVRAGGVDLLLTQNGDLVLTDAGESRLAVGLTNIIQKVRLVLNTVRGSLLHHPEYGFPIQPGDSTAEVTAQDLLRQCKDLFKGDPTFTGVVSAAILKDGPVVKVTLSVGVAGTATIIPITVDIVR